jgi:hypothetical protein
VWVSVRMSERASWGKKEVLQEVRVSRKNEMQELLVPGRGRKRVCRRCGCQEEGEGNVQEVV